MPSKFNAKPIIIRQLITDSHNILDSWTQSRGPVWESWEDMGTLTARIWTGLFHYSCTIPWVRELTLNMHKCNIYIYTLHKCRKMYKQNVNRFFWQRDFGHEAFEPCPFRRSVGWSVCLSDILS